jgi:hypothetical protein
VEHISYGEASLYQGELIRCQSYYDDYACSCGGDAISGGDGIDSSTRVPIVMCVWVFVVTSCHAWH